MTTTQTVLKDICIRITKGTTPTTMGRPFVEEGINFIKAEALNGDTSLEQGGFAFIDEDTHQMLRRSILEQDDVLVTIAGANTGRCGFVKEGDLPANTNQAVGIVRVDKEKADPRFIYYFFKQKQTAQYIQTLSAQAAQPNLNLANLGAIRVELPSRAEQDRIASILSAYDDLIENNRRRIQLLEQAARLLYKEWFVHLRFPGHEHTKIYNGIPEGWEKKTYADLFQFLGGFAFKSKTYQGEGKYGIVTIKNVHDASFVPECSSFIDNPPKNMKEYCLLKTGDMLLSLTGNVGRACVVYGENYLLNQRVAKIVGKPGIPPSFVYWTFSNEDTQKQLENLSYGVAQLNLSPMKLGARDFLKPSPTLLNLFSETVESIFQQITKLNLQIQQLAKARDLLLPRLMNGEWVT